MFVNVWRCHHIPPNSVLFLRIFGVNVNVLIIALFISTFVTRYDLHVDSEMLQKCLHLCTCIYYYVDKTVALHLLPWHKNTIRNKYNNVCDDAEWAGRMLS